MLEFNVNSKGFIEFLALAGIFLWIYKKFWTAGRRRTGAKGSTEPPEVPGALPIIGHLHRLYRNPNEFLIKCKQQFGNMYTIRAGRRKIAVMCDRTKVPEFFAADEKTLSFNYFVEMTRTLHVLGGSMNCHDLLGIARPVIKESMTRVMTQLVTSNSSYLGKRIAELKKEAGNVTTLSDALHKSYYGAALNTLLGVEPTPQLLKAYRNLESASYFIMLMTFLVPEFILDRVIVPLVKRLQKKLAVLLTPIVQRYYDDTNERSSAFLRCAVDHKSPFFGRVLTIQETVNVLIVVTFATVGLPNVICKHVLISLMSRPDLWNQIRAELNPDTVSASDIFAHKLLNAVIYETIRTNAGIGLNGRKTFPSTYFNSYYVGNVELLWIPGCFMLGSEEGGKEIFENPEAFNPERFLKAERPERMDPRSILLWGAGAHHCPGKNWSLNMIKIFVVNFVQHFDLEVYDTHEKRYLPLHMLNDLNEQIKITPVMLQQE